MNQLRETLVRNTAKYRLDKVFDYQTEKKWDFFKLDTMIWNDFVDAKSMGLTNEKIRTIYEEHTSSIEASIHGAAKIYSITLNQCYKRKKQIAYLIRQEKKYQNIIKFIDTNAKQYYEELKKIQQYSTDIERIKYITNYTDNSTLFNFREDISQLEQNQQLNIKEFVEFFNYLLEALKSLKARMEKEQEELLRTIEKNKDSFNKEVEIMDTAASNMKEMRGNYLCSLVYYVRLEKKDKKDKEKEAFKYGSMDITGNSSNTRVQENTGISEEKLSLGNETIDNDDIVVENEGLTTI